MVCPITTGDHNKHISAVIYLIFVRTGEGQVQVLALTLLVNTERFFY